MKKIIKTRPVFDVTESLAEHPVLHRIYAARGIKNKNALDYALKYILPFQDLKSIALAVDRLLIALKNQESILIVGDYDADGATSTAIAVRALSMMGAQNVDFLVPNRFEYGYGLSPAIVDLACENKPNLIVTVDNGIVSFDGANRAREKGIDVIITDHHLAAEKLPEVVAVVNPNQPGDAFKSKMLAGCGVIFYVMLALRARLRELNWFEHNNLPEPNMANLLDIVALGTVADVVPLDHNNRILVSQGLARIRKGQCVPGIRALLQIGKRQLRKVVASDLGFAVAPRLNAAGRLDDMRIGIQCLLTDSDSEAMSLARKLDALNQTRKQLEDKMKAEAFNALKQLHSLEGQTLPIALCLYDPTWHQGVTGIVAGRVKEKYHRPTVVFAKTDEGELKASARSIPGLHIRDALEAVHQAAPELLTKFGGHAMAAGLSLKEKDLEQFKVLFNDVVSKRLSDSDLEATIETDGELDAKEFDLPLAKMLQAAGPWGQVFPEPLFYGEFSLLDQRIVGNHHLKMLLATADKTLDAIAFGVDLKQWPNHRCQKIRAAFRLDVNEFRQRENLQLMIEYFEPV